MFKFLKQKNVSDGTPIQKFLLYIGIPLNILVSIGGAYISEEIGLGIFLFIYIAMLMCFVWDSEIGDDGYGIDC